MGDAAVVPELGTFSDERSHYYTSGSGRTTRETASVADCGSCGEPEVSPAQAPIDAALR
jgi:hypothetical protein